MSTPTPIRSSDAFYQQAANLKRVFVVSDLHLGGPVPRMMSRPDTLAKFILQLASIQESIELVIAGDFVDFLAIEPAASFTPNANEARDKLLRTVREPPFDVVFSALGKLLNAGHDLTVLVGNHDIEFALPQVQDALLAHLAASPRSLHFVDDGRAYRVGRALIEHGNRYDDANLNDWDGLRRMASAFSRFETAPLQVEVSAGSQLVDLVLNPIKNRYPFIDLLQPQNELVVLLLLAFEPTLIFHVKKLARLLRAKKLSAANSSGARPTKTSAVRFEPAQDMFDGELADAFPDGVYETLHQLPTEVSFTDLVRIAWQASSDSLVEILDRGEPIPNKRLQQIRLVMQRLLLGDEGHRLDGDTAQYGNAAQRIIAASKGAVEVVLMGHTHLARCIGPTKRASYINTGTWADIIRVPESALSTDENDSAADDSLSDFLRRLLRDERSDIPHPYAELTVADDGAVLSNELKWVPVGSGG